MKYLRTIIKTLLALLAIFLLLTLLLSLLPMGTGSESYANKWAENFHPIKNVNQAIEMYPIIEYKKFDNGEWIIGISSNSHYNPWGGTIVTKDSNETIKSFFGHVCGVGFLQMIFPRAKSTNEVYKLLSKGFTEYKPKIKQQTKETVK